MREMVCDVPARVQRCGDTSQAKLRNMAVTRTDECQVFMSKPSEVLAEGVAGSLLVAKKAVDL